MFPQCLKMRNSDVLSEHIDSGGVLNVLSDFLHIKRSCRRVDFPKADGLVTGHRLAPRNHGCMRKDSWFAGSRQPIHDRRNAKPPLSQEMRG